MVIIDIGMPDLNGIEATRQIVAENPGVKVIALSMHSDKRFVKGMLKAGASGYLLKYCASEELIAAIEMVMANRVYLSHDITGIVVEGSVRKLADADASAFQALDSPGTGSAATTAPKAGPPARWPMPCMSV